MCLTSPAGADAGRWVDVSITGDAPEGRWRHSATTVGTSIYVFGGLVDDRKRFNDMFKLYCGPRPPNPTLHSPFNPTLHPR